MSSTERTRKWRDRNPEKAAMESTRRNIKWRKKNPEKAREQARERLKRFSEKNPNKYLELRKKWGRKSRRNLSDQYVKSMLANDGILAAKDIPAGMILAKRAELKLKRTLKEMTYE